MARPKPEEPTTPLPPPATTLEGREEQLISASMNLIEKRIHDGTASAQETVHFAKQGSLQNRLAIAKLQAENEVLKARVKEMESKTSSEGMYAEALQAFRGYAGIDPVDVDGYEDDGY